MYPELTMTPSGSSQENPITPGESEKTADETVTPAEETENKTEQTKNETNNLKTGDNIILYVAIAGVSLAGLVTMFENFICK